MTEQNQDHGASSSQHRGDENRNAPLEVKSVRPGTPEGRVLSEELLTRSDKLVKFSWKKHYWQKDLLHLYGLIENTWSPTGTLKASTMRGCAQNIGVILETYPILAQGVFAQDATVMKFVSEKTKPRYSANRKGDEVDPMWTVNDMITWLLIHTQNRGSSGLPSRWSRGTIFQNDYNLRNEIVTALCIYWKRQTSTINTRLNAATSKNTTLIKFWDQ